jgi:hypothetical protein
MVRPIWDEVNRPYAEFRSCVFCSHRRRVVAIRGRRDDRHPSLSVRLAEIPNMTDDGRSTPRAYAESDGSAEGVVRDLMRRRLPHIPDLTRQSPSGGWA